MKILRDNGPQSSLTIKKFLPKNFRNLKNSKTRTNIIGHVLRWAESRGEVEYGNVGVSSWRKSDQLFSIANNVEKVYNNQKQSDIALALWYFKQYGPATEQDFLWWSGLPVNRARISLLKISDQLEEIQIQDYSFPNARLYMLSENVAKLKATSSSDITNVVRFLPYEDALLKAYKLTRNRFFGFSDTSLSTFITEGGEAKPSVWLNGKIIGLWEWKNKKNHEMTIIIPDCEQMKSQIEKEAAQLQNFIEASSILWKDLDDQRQRQKKRIKDDLSPRPTKKIKKDKIKKKSKLRKDEESDEEYVPKKKKLKNRVSSSESLS